MLGEGGVCRRLRGGRTIRRAVQVSGEAGWSALGGGLHGIPRTVGVASRGLDLAVTEKLANHGRAFTQGKSPGGAPVSEILFASDTLIRAVPTAWGDPPRFVRCAGKIYRDALIPKTVRASPNGRMRRSSRHCRACNWSRRPLRSIRQAAA